MKILLFLAAAPVYCFSQASINGAICNKEKLPVPFANIVSVKKQNGIASHQDGTFSLNGLGHADTLKITAIGYHTKWVPVKQWPANDTILLDKKVKVMDEVVVANFSLFKNIESLGFLKRKVNVFFNFYPGHQIATFIRNTKNKPGWIKEVSFKIKTNNRCKCGFRIRLLKADGKTNAPTVDILTGNVIIKPQDIRRKNKIDISDYKALLPKEGVYVVLEWLYTDKECDEKSVTSILGNMGHPVNLVWTNYRDRGWLRFYEQRNQYVAPNVGLKVAYRQWVLPLHAII